MNTIDLLIGLDAKKVKSPTQEVNMKRLSELAGAPVIFKCQALDSSTYNDIQNDAMDMNDKKGTVDYDVEKSQTFTVLNGVVEPNLKDKKLLEHYNVVTPKDLLKKLLLPGEIIILFNLINNLSGFGKDAIENIKN